MKQKKIAIIGAGIVGVMCACFLQREGHKVTLFDDKLPGSETSFGNSGIISPGAVVPIAMPGLIRNVPSWLLKSDGPLSMDWNMLLTHLPWLMRFLLNSKESYARRNSDGLSVLNTESLDLLKPLLSEANLSHLIEQKGMLYAYKTKEEFLADNLAIELREAADCPSRRVSGEQLRDIEPNLSDQFSEGIFFPEVMHTVDPYKLVQKLADHFIELGGEYVAKKVNNLALNTWGRPLLSTNNGVFQKDICLVAAGIWSKQFANDLGYKVPLISHRGYHVTVEDPGINLNTVVCPSGYMATIVPMDMGIRIGGTVELSHINKPLNKKRTEVLLINLKKALPAINISKFTTWMGNRPCTPDSLPIICQAPLHQSIMFAFGHGHQGVISAPKTAQIVTNLVSERKPTINMKFFDIQRFNSSLQRASGDNPSFNDIGISS